jgi:hypothetical protein
MLQRKFRREKEDIKTGWKVSIMRDVLLACRGRALWNIWWEEKNAFWGLVGKTEGRGCLGNV